MISSITLLLFVVAVYLTLNDPLRIQPWSQDRRERGSMIGEGVDTTISSPGRSPKQPLPGIGPHDPLHGRQA